MPAPPPRLRPWLDALGTGGTLAQAERLAQLAEASRTTITLTPETEIRPGHVYALSFPDDVYTAIDDITPLIDDLSNLTGALFVTLIRGATLAEVTGPDSALVAQLITDRVAARAESTRLRAALQRLASAEDTARDALIDGPDPGEPAAALDLAATLTKEVRAAVRRAIDIARTQPPRFQFQDAPGEPLPAIPDDAYPPGSTPLPPPVGWDDPTGREAAATVALDHDPQAETFTIPAAPGIGVVGQQIHGLIEASSLGTPEATAARASVPLEQGEAAADGLTVIGYMTAHSCSSGRTHVDWNGDIAATATEAAKSIGDEDTIGGQDFVVAVCAVPPVNDTPDCHGGTPS